MLPHQAGIPQNLQMLGHCRSADRDALRDLPNGQWPDSKISKIPRRVELRKAESDCS